MKSWANNPIYQRAMQRIAALQPHHRAILQNATADASFADERMRKSLNSMIQATANTSRRKNLDLRKEGFAKRVGMAERDLDYNKGRDKKAFGLGIANLGLSGVSGLKQRQRDKKLMDMIDAMTKKYQLAGISPELKDQPNIGLKRRGNYSPWGE